MSLDFLVQEPSRLRDIIASARTIAVVGLSSRPDRPSQRVAAYLQAHGYRIIPVNPHESRVLGVPAVRTLDDVQEPIDVVQVFRRPEEAPEVARAAVRKRARVLWLQDGVVSELAAGIAHEGGLAVVMDRCMLRDHVRLIGR